MKKIILLTSIFAITFLFQTCSNDSDNAVSTEPTPIDTVQQEEVIAITKISEDVDAEKFKTLIENPQGYLIDVRTPEEFNSGHLTNAININYNSPDFYTAIDSLDNMRPVYLYCQAGGRSTGAKEIMFDKGFKEVYNLIGGYSEYPYKN